MRFRFTILILILCYNAATYNQGARVSDYYYTYNGDEETLKTLVARKGE